MLPIDGNWIQQKFVVWQLLVAAGSWLFINSLQQLLCERRHFLPAPSQFQPDIKFDRFGHAHARAPAPSEYVPFGRHYVVAMHQSSSRLEARSTRPWQSGGRCAEQKTKTRQTSHKLDDLERNREGLCPTYQQGSHMDKSHLVAKEYLLQRKILRKVAKNYRKIHF